MSLTQSAPHLPSRRMALIAIGLLFVIELAVIGTIFKHGISFRCLDNWPSKACSGASTTLVAIYCAVGALTLLVMLIPQPVRALLGGPTRLVWPLIVNLVGVVIALIPVTFMQDGAGSAVLVPAFVCWSLGMGLILAGILGALAPISRWRVFLGDHWQSLIPVLLAGLAVPSLSTQIRPIWRMEHIANITFDGVSGIVQLLGYQVEVYTEQQVIGFGEFFIDIAPQCSGVEGIALVTLFVTIYLAMFRRELRFPRALLLYPIGILASAGFNVLRITLLLIIGLEGHPELAVGGFHSHAGWLMFTVISLGVIALARSVPGLQKATVAVAAPAPVLPFFQDPTVARIFPFLVFMATALLASTFSQTPSVVYPLRAIVVAAALIAFLPIYRKLTWAPGVTAWAVGAVIGVAWVLIPAAPPETDAMPYGALTGGLLVLWFIARGVGTILLVPVLEELFFRDYLPKRLAFGTGVGWVLLGIFISAVAFAALHGRWAEAFAAAIALHWLYHRTGRITDAIVAHGVANAIVFGVALATGQMHII